MYFDSPHKYKKNYRCSYFSHQAIWHPGSEPSGGNDVVVYATHAIVVAMEIATGIQHFFIGHTGKVSALIFNDCTRKSNYCMLAIYSKLLLCLTNFLYIFQQNPQLF